MPLPDVIASASRDLPIEQVEMASAQRPGDLSDSFAGIGLAVGAGIGTLAGAIVGGGWVSVLRILLGARIGLVVGAAVGIRQAGHTRSSRLERCDGALQLSCCDTRSTLVGDGSYLEDVAWVFTVVRVVNSAMMFAGWDTPKSGTFAYVHLLSRLAIVAAVVALFHLDGIRNVIGRWSDADGRRATPTGERCGTGRSLGVLPRSMRRAPLDRVVVAFTLVTTAFCVIAIASSMFWEPAGGVVLYQALIGLAATLTVLVGGWAW